MISEKCSRLLVCRYIPFILFTLIFYTSSNLIIQLIYKGNAMWWSVEINNNKKSGKKIKRSLIWSMFLRISSKVFGKIFNQHATTSDVRLNKNF